MQQRQEQDSQASESWANSVTIKPLWCGIWVMFGIIFCLRLPVFLIQWRWQFNFTGYKSSKGSEKCFHDETATDKTNQTECWHSIYADCDNIISHLFSQFRVSAHMNLWGICVVYKIRGISEDKLHLGCNSTYQEALKLIQQWSTSSLHMGLICPPNLSLSSSQRQFAESCCQALLKRCVLLCGCFALFLPWLLWALRVRWDSW